MAVRRRRRWRRKRLGFFCLVGKLRGRFWMGLVIRGWLIERRRRRRISLCPRNCLVVLPCNPIHFQLSKTTPCMSSHQSPEVPRNCCWPNTNHQNLYCVQFQ